MKPHLPLLATTVLLGCSAGPARPLRPTLTPSGEAVRPPGPPVELTVRAREMPVVPECTAADPVVLAPLTAGLAASPALARGPQGALVAFIAADGSNRPVLRVLALDAQGRPRGSPQPVVTAGAPSAPALVARGDGYLLAWRQGRGDAERIATIALDAEGRTTGTAALQGTAGRAGAPALATDGTHDWIAFGQRATPPADLEHPQYGALALIGIGGTTASFEAPEGGAFDGRAPVLLADAGGPQVFATLARRGAPPGDERSLVQLSPGHEPVLVARDLDHPAALDVPQGTLLAWRARVALHDVAIRTLLVHDDGSLAAPPITLATFEGAYGAEVALAPLGPAVAALTFSTLADSAVGSLNLSLVAPDGSYVGRAPMLTGLPVRSARLAVSAREDQAWVLLDARDDTGTPRLALERVSCDFGRQREPLDIPPPTMVQHPADPDAAPVSLARPGTAALACEARPAQAFVEHTGAGDDVLADSSSAVVVTARGATLLAVARTGVAGPPRLAVSTLDARGRRSPVRWVPGTAGRVLAAEAVAGGVLAVATEQRDGSEMAMLVQVDAGGRPRATPLRVRAPSSAAIVPETGAVLLVGEVDGDTAVLRVTGGRAPVVVAPAQPGDVLLDVLREGHATSVLLARPDPQGAEIARVLVRVSVPDAASEATVADPFADPLGYGRGNAQWVRAAGGPGVLYSEPGVLRAAAIAQGGLHQGHSVLELHHGGGGILSSAWSGPDRWVALATGIPDDAHASARAITVAALGEGGAVRALTSRLPDDASGVGDAVALGVAGRRVVVLYPRTGQGRTMQWMIVDATCTLPGGAP